MTILNNNMNQESAAQLVINAMKKATNATFNPYHWTFITNDGCETVEFISDKINNKFVYTRIKKFLFFKFGLERIYLSSNYVNVSLWNEMDDVMHNTIARIGVNL